MSILPLGERGRVHAGAAHEEDQTARNSFTLIVRLTDEEIFRIFKAVQTPRDNAITSLLLYCSIAGCGHRSSRASESKMSIRSRVFSK